LVLLFRGLNPTKNQYFYELDVFLCLVLRDRFTNKDFFVFLSVDNFWIVFVSNAPYKSRLKSSVNSVSF